MPATVRAFLFQLTSVVHGKNLLYVCTAQSPAQRPAPPARPVANLADMDDDIPF